MMIECRSALGLLAGGWTLCLVGAFEVSAAPRPEINVYKDPSFKVLLFTADGSHQVFATYP